MSASPKALAKGQNPRSSWLEEEDTKLAELVGVMGERNWALIAQELPGRVGKQCRERWRNHLNPNIRHDPFTQEEDDTIIRFVKEVGTRWARISELMKGRTENSIKNRYHCFLKRKVEVRSRSRKKLKAILPSWSSPQSTNTTSIDPNIKQGSDQENALSDKSLETSNKSKSPGSNTDSSGLSPFSLPPPDKSTSEAHSTRRRYLARHHSGPPSVSGTPKSDASTEATTSGKISTSTSTLLQSIANLSSSSQLAQSTATTSTSTSSRPYISSSTKTPGVIPISDLVSQDDDVVASGDATCEWSAAVALCALRSGPHKQQPSKQS